MLGKSKVKSYNITPISEHTDSKELKPHLSSAKEVEERKIVKNRNAQSLSYL
jgi:hypothetical protein